jgi:hypothetical protein
LEIEGFEGVGKFEDGSLDHRFADRDIFLPPEKSKAETDEVKARVIEAYKGLGDTLLEEILKGQGYDEETAQKIAREILASNPANTDDGEPIEGDEDTATRAERILQRVRGEPLPPAE